MKIVIALLLLVTSLAVTAFATSPQEPPIDTEPVPGRCRDGCNDANSCVTTTVNGIPVSAQKQTFNPHRECGPGIGECINVGDQNCVLTQNCTPLCSSCSPANWHQTSTCTS